MQFKEMRRIDILPDGWIEILALINLLLVLSPQLGSGYFWDDYLLSTATGAMRINHTNFLGLTLLLVKKFWETQHRFIPFSALSLLPIFYLPLFYYKLCTLLLILSNVYLLGCLAAKIGKSKSLKIGTLVLSPLFFKLGYVPDSIMAFHSLLPFCFSIILLSLLEFWIYLEGSRLFHLAASLILYFLALLTYEITYPFFVIYMGIAILRIDMKVGVTNKLRHSSRNHFWIGLPFMIATLTIMFGLFFASVLSPIKDSPYDPSFNIEMALLKLLMHLSATVPLSNIFLSVFSNSISDRLAFVEEMIRYFSDRGSYLPLGIGLIQYFLLAHFLRKYSTTSIRKIELIFLGLSLIILPGLMIVFASKYQTSPWIDWGVSYIPVYFGFMGALILSVIVLFRILDLGLLKNNARFVFPFLSLLGAFISVATYANNRTAVSVMNRSTHFSHRGAMEAALRAGILEIVPQDAFLVVNTFEQIDQNPAFYRKFHDSRLRRVVGPMSYTGLPVGTSDFAIRTFFGPDISESFPATSMKNAPEEGPRQYTFSPEDEVYYLSAIGSSESNGYVVLARLSNYAATYEKIFGAASSEAYVFIQSSNFEKDRSLRNYFQIDGNLQNKSNLRVASHFQMPLNQMEEYRTGPDWAIYHLKFPMAPESLVDLLSLKLLSGEAKLPE